LFTWFTFNRIVKDLHVLSVVSFYRWFFIGGFFIGGFFIGGFFLSVVSFIGGLLGSFNNLGIV